MISTQYRNGEMSHQVLKSLRQDMLEAQMVETVKKELSLPHVQQVRVTKIGRNELCPCGSGKKFKKCHLDQAREV